MIATALQPARAVDFRRQRRYALLASAIMAATVVVPHVVVGGVALGADDFVALVSLPLLPIALLVARDTPLAPATVLVGALWLAILVHGCLMGLAATAQYFGHAAFPTEMWQYVKRATFFYVAFLVVSSQSSIEPSYKALAALLLVACLIGIAQIGSGAIAEFVASLYARTDAQLEHLVGRGWLRAGPMALPGIRWRGAASVFSARPLRCHSCSSARLD